MNKEIFINEKAWNMEWNNRWNVKYKLQRCKKCLYDVSIPSLKLDYNGVCNYCKMHSDLLMQYPGGQIGLDSFEKIAHQIKLDGKNKKYDLIIGVSGGIDSSYMIHLARQYNLRALAVHFDNTYNSAAAVQNISTVLKNDIELYTHVVNNKEYDDTLLSFMQAGTLEVNIANDIGLAATLNEAAAKFNVNYIFEGHSFKAEGVSPMGWFYGDSKYIKSVVKEFGKTKIKSLPQMWLYKQIIWMLFNKIRKIRPLWYLDYTKQTAKSLLQKEYNWIDYGGHHLENRTTMFTHTFLMPRRFNIDQRANSLSAQIRMGELSREDGLEILASAPKVDDNNIEFILNRLNLSEARFIEYMTLPIKTYKDYKTYKQTFERMRPFFYLMAKLERIPWSFYHKYTSKEFNF